jgi:Mg-chelatase subunit ChlI
MQATSQASSSRRVRMAAARRTRQRFEVGDEIVGAVAERRPRAAVDRPAEPLADLGRVAVSRTGRHDAARDHHTAEGRRRVGERNIEEENRLAGLGEPVGPDRREDRARRDGHPSHGPRPVLQDVEDAVPAWIPAGEERRPGGPRVGGQAGTRDSAAASPDERGQRGQLAGREEGIEDVPVGAVPGDEEHALRHGRAGYPAPERRSFRRVRPIAHV